MIISIDGPAGSGKSTVADILAERLGFIHFNSGSLYRAITAYLNHQNFDFKSIQVESPVFNLDLRVEFIEGVQHMFVNEIDYTSEIRNNTISTLTPIVSTNRSIRKIVDNCQKQYCSTHNSIIDGRDIGSFVFTKAEFKFYLDCSVEERARRRFLEEQAKGTHISIEEIEKQIIERDIIDKTKKIAPLVVPENAIIVDSSNLTIEEVVSTMINHIQMT